jgi:flagellar hook-length control protein FliK
MINAASAITATTPGQPGKGASPAGGDPFTLPFELAFDLPAGKAAPVGRSALLNGTSRQIAAAAGPALPAAGVEAIDPALAWLPAVNIPAPAPLDVPPAVAAVPATGILVPESPDSVSDGTQAARPAAVSTPRDASLTAQLPAATVGRFRNAPRADETSAVPTPPIARSRPHVATDTVAGPVTQPSGTTGVKNPDVAHVEQADLGVERHVPAFDAAPDRPSLGTTPQPAILQGIARSPASDRPPLSDTTVTAPGAAISGQPAAVAVTGYQDTDPRVAPAPEAAPIAARDQARPDRRAILNPSVRPDLTTSVAGAVQPMATPPIAAVRPAPQDGVVPEHASEPNLAADLPAAAVLPADGTRPATAIAQPATHDLPGPDRNIEPRLTTGAPEAATQQSGNKRPAPSQATTIPRSTTRDADRPDQIQYASPEVGTPEATPPSAGVQLASPQTSPIARPAMHGASQADQDATLHSTADMPTVATPHTHGDRPTSAQAGVMTPPATRNYAPAERDAKLNPSADMSEVATPNTDGARPTSAQADGVPPSVIRARRSVEPAPAADMPERVTLHTGGVQPVMQDVAAPILPAARDAASATPGMEPPFPVAGKERPMAYGEANPAASSMSDGVFVPVDAQVPSPRADDRPEQPMPQASPERGAAPMTQARANPATIVTDAPQIVPAMAGITTSAPAVRERIVIGAVAASPLASATLDAAERDTPSLPIDARSRSAAGQANGRMSAEDMPAALSITQGVADSDKASTPKADEDSDDHDEPASVDSQAPAILPTAQINAAPTAPAPVIETAVAGAVSEKIDVATQRTTDAPVENGRRQPAANPADVSAAEPMLAAQPEIDAGTGQDGPAPIMAAMDAPIEPGLMPDAERQPNLAEPSSRSAAGRREVTVPLPDAAPVEPTASTSAGAAQGAQPQPAADPIAARRSSQGKGVPRQNAQPGALPRGAVDRAGPALQAPVTRDVAAPTSLSPDSAEVAGIAARTPMPTREAPPRPAASAIPSPVSAPVGAATEAAAPLRPEAAAPASTVPAPAALPTPALPTPAAVPPQRPVFVREVAGVSRQTVALRPQAAAQPQPGAGTTAPAAQIFGAAMHAATTIEERKPVDDAEPMPTPIAAPAELRPLVATSDGTLPSLDMRQDGWPSTMIDRIEHLRDAANANDTRIRLVPDALGGIAISVKSVGDALHVRFVADQEATRALIENAQPQLAAVAEERGLRIGQTVVETASAAQTQGNASQGNANGQQSSGQSSSNQNQAQTPSGNNQPGGQPGAGQAQAQAGQQQSRQQQPSTARQATAPARAPSHDTDAAGDGRVA